MPPTVLITMNRRPCVLESRFAMMMLVCATVVNVLKARGLIRVVREPTGMGVKLATVSVPSAQVAIMGGAMTGNLQAVLLITLFF